MSGNIVGSGTSSVGGTPILLAMLSKLSGILNFYGTTTYDDIVVYGHNSETSTGSYQVLYVNNGLPERISDVTLSMEFLNVSGTGDSQWSVYPRAERVFVLVQLFKCDSETDPSKVVDHMNFRCMNEFVADVNKVPISPDGTAEASTNPLKNQVYATKLFCIPARGIRKWDCNFIGTADIVLRDMQKLCVGIKCTHDMFSHAQDVGVSVEFIGRFGHSSSSYATSTENSITGLNQDGSTVSESELKNLQ